MEESRALARLPRIPVPGRARLFAAAHGDRGGPDARADSSGPRRGGTSSPRRRSRRTPPGARRSTACAPHAAGAKISARGTPGVRSGRSSSKIRAVYHLGQPIAGADGESRIEPVHMHLEHRISQRLLSPVPVPGFRLPRPLARLPDPDGGLAAAGLPARAALPLRPSGHAAARGRHRRLRGVDPTRGPAAAPQTDRQEESSARRKPCAGSTRPSWRPT